MWGEPMMTEVIYVSEYANYWLTVGVACVIGMLLLIKEIFRDQ